MKNHDIQFFFNRPDRSVNSGRISGIRAGTYSNSASIEIASDAELDAFFLSFQPTKVSASVSVPSGDDTSISRSPTDSLTLSCMFRKEESGIWRFNLGESDRHECKKSFGFKHADAWLRAIAALANNQGGYIFFGVYDKTSSEGQPENSYRVIGLSGGDFENSDPAEFSKKIKSTFDPTPRVENLIFELDGLKIGVLHVYQHVGRPVIATKNEGHAIKEGDIFFRYPGQSTRIKYSDLRAILDERDRMAREQILPMVSKLLSLGPRNAMIADLANGTLSDERRSLIIGDDLLDRINFIREGEFKEVDGDPTLRLVGDVQVVSADGNIIRKGFITPKDIIEDFLDVRRPYDPREYIKYGVECGNSKWLPIHFYARDGDLDRAALAEFIMDLAAHASRKEFYRDRAMANKAFRPASGKAAVVASRIEHGSCPKVENLRDASIVGQAIIGLDKRPQIDLINILELLRSCKAILSEEKPAWMTTVRRAIARVDELYYADL